MQRIVIVTALVVACTRPTNPAEATPKSDEESPVQSAYLQVAVLAAEEAESECTLDRDEWIGASPEGAYACLRLSTDSTNDLHLVAVPRVFEPADDSPLLAEDDDVGMQQSALVFAIPIGIAAYDALLILTGVVVAGVALKTAVDVAQLNNGSLLPVLEANDHVAGATELATQIHDAPKASAGAQAPAGATTGGPLPHDPCTAFYAGNGLLPRGVFLNKEQRQHAVDACYDAGVGFTGVPRFAVVPGSVQIQSGEALMINFGSTRSGYMLHIHAPAGYQYLLPPHRFLIAPTTHTGPLRLQVVSAGAPISDPRIVTLHG